MLTRPLWWGFLFLSGLVVAQAPTSAIRGLVADASGGAIPKATVEVENKQLGLARLTATNSVGEFVVSALPPGLYDVRVSAPGFRTTTKPVELFVGRELTVNFSLEIGGEKQMVTVSGEFTQVNTSEHKVEGIISRQQIEHLPLNGRNALELARLQPGVLVGSGVPSGKNNFVGVSIAGETSAATRITVDGGGVNDYVTGGSLQNFSQEVVQEFQVSTGNFDPSTGITSAGAINIVTRSGTNRYHGTAFAFVRDSSFAANPALERNPLNPNPKFDREQYGYLASGPVVKDRLFWLTSIDRTRQRGVAPLIANNVELTSFNVIKKEPFDVMLQTHKLDWSLGQRHRMNFRYSRDGNQGSAGGSLSENQRINQNSADQYLFNWNVVANPHLVNDYRIQFNKYSNYYKPTPEALALGFPATSVRQSNITFGIDDNSPQSTLLGRLEMHDNISHQVG
ncbi:MAG: carboxypeptidase regulatory-like domain-containing protein, partial [Acidobacteria bacterium]|nr:carboxypeptidase regulatory-like domain-containing protein [Acidobacteriota bacterium]